MAHLSPLEPHSAHNVAFVPFVSSLGSVYATGSTSASAVEARLAALTAQFEKIYGQPPSFVARAPGRVNLIGEHIDYEGYAVLPMAIELDTLVAIRPQLVLKDTPSGASTEDRPLLRIANMDSSVYPSVEFPADPLQEVDIARHSWANYFLCGYKGVYDYLAAQGLLEKKWTSIGLNILVHGLVPQGSGLSSSAALVCSSAIAVASALDLRLPKADVAEFACTCERYIGTQSGGMDQAISIMARPGVALRIAFNPISVEDVVLPPGAAFVIANSLTVSKKAETAAINYNNRVVECRLAAIVLALALGMEREAALDVHMLCHVESLCSKWKSTKRREGDVESLEKESLSPDPLPAVEALLHSAAYSKEELEGILKVPLSSIFSSSPSSLAVLSAASHFKLQQRALHVFSEAKRVEDFRHVTSSVAKGDLSAEEGIRQLGTLMVDSHRSCSKLYECSCPELEELVSVALKSGAVGARLTGAGWGGCAVLLVREGDEGRFISELKDNFYARRVAQGIVKEEDLGNVLFASKPGGGAAILKL